MADIIIPIKGSNAIKGCSMCSSIASATECILQTKYWLVILAHNQAHLGRSFVTLRRHVESLAALTHDEWQDFEATVRRIETAYVAALGSGQPFNWTCLMNNAYKTAEPQPHVHWHVRPRHQDAVMINGIKFTDPEYRHHYDRTREQLIDAETRSLIISKLRASLKDTSSTAF